MHGRYKRSLQKVCAILILAEICINSCVEQILDMEFPGTKCDIQINKIIY